MGLELSQHRPLLFVSGQVPEQPRARRFRGTMRADLGQRHRGATVMIAETVDGKWLLEIEAIAAE
jgi:enamine deaminase RidA (YjgF/YER057c/UK114 family)